MMWSEFHLLRPWWLLALLPLLFVVWRLQRDEHSRNPWLMLVDEHLLDFLRHPLTTFTHRVPQRLLLIGWLVAVVALSGPTWSRTPPLIFRPAVPPLVIVLDLSRRMDVTDLKPSRLVVAKLKLQLLLERLPPRPVGLVVYAGSAHLVLPLTEDRRLVSITLDALESGLMPHQGRAAAAGLLKGQELISKSGETKGELLLVGSGVEAAAVDVARRLGKSGIAVSVLAFGTTLPASVPGSGSEPDLLRQLASSGRGRFAPVGHNDRDIERILGGIAHPVTSTGPGEQGEGEVWQDRGGELVLLLLPLALLAFRRGWLGMVVLTVGLHAPESRAFEWDGLWLNPNQQGMRVLQAGEPGQAALLFSDPLWRGVAHYRNGDFEEALAEFAAWDLPLAHYNRGNALIRLGRTGEALAAYERVIELEPGHADAHFNRDRLVAALLRREQHETPLPQPALREGERQQEVEKRAPVKPYVEERLESLDPDHLAQPDLRVLERQHGVDATLGGAAMLLQAPEGVEGELGISRGPEANAGPEGTETDSEATERISGAAAGGESGLEQAEADSVAPAQERGTAVELDEGDQEENRVSSRTTPSGEERKAGSESDTEAGGVVASESELALEQWLNRIPDDPGGYLKEKFAREYRSQSRQRGEL